MNKEKVVLIIAPVGALTLEEKTPKLPISPEEIAEATFEAYEAGASIVHIHSRDVNTRLSTPDINVYNDICQHIKDKCDILQEMGGMIGAWYEKTPDGKQKVCLPTDKQKLALADIVPKPDIITVNPCSFTFELVGVDYKTFENTPDFQKRMVRRCIRDKIHVEFEVYDTSHLFNIQRRFDDGSFKKLEHFNLDYVFGVAGGQAPSVKQLVHIQEIGEKLFPGQTWQVTALGKWEMPLLTTGIVMGCDSIRVGFEDNIYISKGKLAENNAELVKKAVRIAKELGREIATVDETREIFKIPK